MLDLDTDSGRLAFWGNGRGNDFTLALPCSPFQTSCELLGAAGSAEQTVARAKFVPIRELIFMLPGAGW
jgi:hypothetical protein